VLSGSGAADAYVRELSAPGALHAFLGLYRALSWEELSQVDDVEVPVVFVHGDGDEVFAPGTVRRTIELLRPPSRAVQVVHGGHWLPEQQSGAVVREVLALIAQTQGEAQADHQQEDGADAHR
jgi:pimeloyl-ACP methyl ester carboxylesterase